MVFGPGGAESVPSSATLSLQTSSETARASGHAHNPPPAPVLADLAAVGGDNVEKRGETGREGEEDRAAWASLEGTG